MVDSHGVTALHVGKFGHGSIIHCPVLALPGFLFVRNIKEPLKIAVGADHRILALGYEDLTLIDMLLGYSRDVRFMKAANDLVFADKLHDLVAIVKILTGFGRI